MVVSSYNPAIMADMHRARQLSWELPQLGWDIEILSPDLSYQEPSCIESDAAPFFVPGEKVHFVPAFLPWVFRRLGMRTIGWRAIIPLLRKGIALLRTKKFDLIYFSTSSASLFLLGPVWSAMSGVPYALDIHDPIYKPGLAHPAWANPSFKHRLAQTSAKYIERLSVRGARGIVSVSESYIEQFRKRYASSRLNWSKEGAVTIPFGISEHDFEVAAGLPPECAGDDSAVARAVYVGVGGPVMARAFTAFCEALSDLRRKDRMAVEGIRFEFFGTQLRWREGEPRYLTEIARAHGVDDLIREEPGRVSFRTSLETLVESSGCLILGVDDPAYVPSKLYSYLYAGKPLLACVRHDGAAHAAVTREGADMAHVLSFGARETSAIENANALSAFLRDVGLRRTVDRCGSVERYLASAMAKHHADLFDRCLIRPPYDRKLAAPRLMENG